MRLPFGLDLKTVIVTILFMMFVWPLLMGFLGGRKAASKAAA